ncbi:MAG: SGNH/GDSL hydrolase family protein [Actinobacteria bacterium]|nr:SGNH/GDSL hydrolase family protein [Actinomycetota bacterium]
MRSLNSHRQLKRRQNVFVSVVMALTVTACSAGSSSQSSSLLDGIGVIPGNDFVGQVTLPPTLAASIKFPPIQGPLVGSVAKGNRLLVIGDSIIASTASRYGGEMCRALLPLGWQVAVEAEPSRFVQFGREVLRVRLSDGWDAAVVFLGTNYTGQIDKYTSDLTAIVTSLKPRPVLLLMTSLFRERQKEVNGAIATVASANENVSVLDWTSISSQSGVLNRDKIHPSADGRAVLVTAIGKGLGPAPRQQGKCLSSTFTDDSAGGDEMPDVATTSDVSATSTPITGPTTIATGSSTTVSMTESTASTSSSPITSPTTTTP